MKEIEKMLSEKKLAVEQIEVPHNLENRLRNALENKKTNKNQDNIWKMQLVAGIIALMLITYNFNTFAYYSKKIIGYDELMNSTLQKLNEQGNGQVIEKTYDLKDGVTFTLEAIMLDENQLVALYDIKKSNGNIESIDITPNIYIKGKVNQYFMKSSYGKINEEKTEIKCIAKFETPHIWEKNLKLEFTTIDNKQNKTGSISFELDRNKAMKHILQKKINKVVEIDKQKIHLNSILATPTTTVIKGSIQNIFELAIDQISKNRLRPGGLNVKLFANGKELDSQESSMSTDNRGITFSYSYDSLPPDLKQLEIKITNFLADYDVYKKIVLVKDIQNKSVNILGNDIKFNKIYESNENTYVNITTKKGVVLTRVYMIMDGKNITNEKTIDNQHNKGLNGTITHTRTLEFKGKGKKLIMDIQRISFEKTVNKGIVIPIK